MLCPSAVELSWVAATPRSKALVLPGVGGVPAKDPTACRHRGCSLVRSAGPRGGRGYPKGPTPMTAAMAQILKAKVVVILVAELPRETVSGDDKVMVSWRPARITP